MTHKSFCGAMEDEYHTWQVLIPREGLKHSFLLHGLLAMASLEIAAVGDQPNHTDYVNAAFEYYDKALSSFRSELANITPDKQEAVLAFSMITMVLSLALPQFISSLHEPHSMVKDMIAHFELVRGVGAIALQHWQCFREGPILRNIKLFDELQMKPLEPDLESAIARLNALNEEKHDPVLVQSRTAKLQTITNHAACRKAIFHLEESFTKCEEPANRGYALAWLNLTGKDYVAAVETADPVALLALMHWGVLLERCSDGIWWMQSIGKSLVDEVTKALAAETDPVLRASISWARGQVGL